MEFGDVEAGGWVLESRSPPPPAVTVLEAADVHCSELRIWVTADLEVGPGSPARSLVFLKCYGTLPLCTTSGQKINSGRHFLELVQQKLKERGFGVNPEIPRVYSPVPCSKLVAPWRPVLASHSVVPPHSSRAGRLHVFCSSQVGTRFSHQNPHFQLL